MCPTASFAVNSYSYSLVYPDSLLPIDYLQVITMVFSQELTAAGAKYVLGQLTLLSVRVYRVSSPFS